MNEQENFWANEYGQDYILKNQNFDLNKGADAWKIMLKNANRIDSILECGCNVGRNINFLNLILPETEKSIIEINKTAFEFVIKNFTLQQTFNGSITQSNLRNNFDLVFTMGVLIHIHPDNLLENMKKIASYSRKYILFGESFNRTPMMIEYREKKARLFKRDFGKLFIENFDVKLVDYGFLWGHIYDAAGFDDVTWWLFEKN